MAFDFVFFFFLNVLGLGLVVFFFFEGGRVFFFSFFFFFFFPFVVVSNKLIKKLGAVVMCSLQAVGAAAPHEGQQGFPWQEERPGPQLPLAKRLEQRGGGGGSALQHHP